MQAFVSTNQLTLTPVITQLQLVIDQISEEAENFSGRQQPDSLGIFRVSFVTTSPEIREQIANDLLDFAQVEYVSALPPPLAPPGDYPPPTELFHAQQTFFSPNPGLDLSYAHAQGFQGQGMRYVDIEYCWRPTHEDQVDTIVVPEPEQFPWIGNPPSFCDHGAAVVGFLSATTNGYGVRGAVPFASVRLNPARVGSAGGFRIPNAIINAVASTVPGDVILIEMQATFGSGPAGPAEIDPTTWLETRRASDANRIVVAAAGNGNGNLDSSAYGPYAAFGDSGALIVGAGTATTAHQKLFYSSYGTRVNLQGWGENVATLGVTNLFFPNGDVLQSYGLFDGTSSAAPFVAATAMIVQQKAKSFFSGQDGPLSPAELRRHLTATGIPQSNVGSMPIGPFPNVRRALDELNRADVSVSPSIAGSLVSVPITNLGSSRATNLTVDIDLLSGSVVWLSRIDQSGVACVPRSVQEECAGQCSHLTCDIGTLRFGSPRFLQWQCDSGLNTSFTVKARVAGGSHVDPDSSNNNRTVTQVLSCQPQY